MISRNLLYTLCILCYTDTVTVYASDMEKGEHMPSFSDIVKDAVVEFSRLQKWMISAKKKGDIETYNMMHDRYVELKVILAAMRVNITELDVIKEQGKL